MKKNNLILGSFLVITAFLFCGYRVNSSTNRTSIGKFESSLETGSVVTIGSQVWTSKNLDIATYRNGDIIPQVQDKNAWANLTTGAWCYFDNDASNGKKYGKLYNWYAVNDPRGLAPNGYHIPTDAEWTQLSDYLGGEDIAGIKMKNTNGWNTNGWDDNGNGTNISGFSGLAGGSRNKYGEFKCKIDVCSNYWSFTESDTESAWARHLDGNVDLLSRSNYNKRLGFSVRCVRD